METGVKLNSATRIAVADLHVAHPLIRAKDWCSPLVLRLLFPDSYRDGSRGVQDSFRALADAPPTEGALDLWWKDQKIDCDQVEHTYQAPVITEFATLGLACILVGDRAKLEITEVTRRGEKADYWLGDKELLLEVSGQQSGDIEALCTQKAKQLLDNPFGKPGFVCVAIYEKSAARLWFYEADGEGK
jgi:hypothetical protein